jgi:hypothetical protein
MISAGKSCEYIPACDSKLLDSPWYQITPDWEGRQGGNHAIEEHSGGKGFRPRMPWMHRKWFLGFLSCFIRALFEYRGQGDICLLIHHLGVRGEDRPEIRIRRQFVETDPRLDKGPPQVESIKPTGTFSRV